MHMPRSLPWIWLVRGSTNIAYTFCRPTPFHVVFRGRFRIEKVGSVSKESIPYQKVDSASKKPFNPPNLRIMAGRAEYLK